jgi:hypothetical protein
MPSRSIAAALFSCMVVVATLTFPFPTAVAADGLAAGGGAVVAADRLNLRGGPGVGNPAVDVLTSGTTLRMLAGPVNGTWWRVTDGKRVGYVDGAWLAPAAPPSDPAGFDLDLAFPYHRQMTAIWCDPADLQSWVEYDQGQPLGQDYTVQQQIWDWELSHNAGFTEDQWDASPFAVASAAHNWLPDRGFNHFTYDDPTAATSVAAWLLANPKYREPSVGLIWQGDHYVLIRGVRATSDPFQNAAEARLLGVYVMDPNRGSRSWLGEDRYIPIDDWVENYLTPVTYLTPHTGVPGDVWQGKYVTIQRDWSNDGPTLAGRSNATPRSYAAPN